jgi:hypothetical protein
MDTGKQVLPIGSVYDGAAEEALRTLYIVTGILANEFKITAGTAKIETLVDVVPGEAVGLQTGKLIHADGPTSIPAFGIVSKGALIGQKATIVFGMGHIKGLSGLTPDSIIYTGTAGALLFAAPGAGMVQSIGYAISQSGSGSGGGGGVTTVTATDPVASSGGATPDISLVGLSGFGSPGDVIQVDALGTGLEYAAPAGGGITELTDDVTAGPGSGSQVATLKKVFYAEMWHCFYGGI